MISQKDRERLRALAHNQLEVANSEKNLERTKLWYKHNACEGVRPLIHMETMYITKELYDLQCEDPVARALEDRLLHDVYNVQTLDDDRVVAPYFGVWYDYTNNRKPWGMNVIKETVGDGGLGQQFVEQVEELGEELDKFGDTELILDIEEKDAQRKLAEDVFGDILPVKQVGKGLTCWLTQELTHVMGMENMCYALYDYPDELRDVMNKLADDYINIFTKWSESGILLPTTGFEEVNQGSICLTNDLPSEGPVKLSDVWIHLDSQETINVSQEMFEDIFWEPYKKVAEKFGMVSFGCCDPLQRLWPCLKQLKNLRKASISPWTDEEYMADQLRGTNVVYHRKPLPNYIGVDEVLNEDAWREHISKTLETANGCEIEFAIRDVYTIHGNPDKPRRAVEIMRECIEDHWKG